MGYAETIRDRDRGQLDRVIAVRRYSAARNEFDESVSQLDWTRNVWARRSSDETSVLLDESGTRTVYNPRYVVRHDPDFNLREAGKTFTVTEADGTVHVVQAIEPVGRRRYLELAT